MEPSAIMNKDVWRGSTITEYEKNREILMNMTQSYIATVDREIFTRKNIHLLIFASFYFRRLGIPEV